VLIPGIGSGVSTLAAEFAVSGGGEVWVTSSSNLKIQNAIKLLHVRGGVNYSDKDWVSNLLKSAGQFDVIVDGAGGPSFSQLVAKLLKSGGKLITYGATAGVPPNFPLHTVFLQQKSIIGTTMGSDRDFEQMLTFVKTHKIVPLVGSVRPFEEIITSLKEMEEGKHMGKYVLTFQKSQSKL